MGKNDQTSKRVASIGAQALRGKKLTQKEILSLAGSAVNQAPNKKKKKG